MVSTTVSTAIARRRWRAPASRAPICRLRNAWQSAFPNA